MRWFKHFSDSHTNLKLMDIVHEFGLTGYAVYWICLELVAQQGKDWKLNGTGSWKRFIYTMMHRNALPNELCVEPLESSLDLILHRLAELNLIDANSLKDNILHIPKMAEYADTYTVRSLCKVRSNSSTSTSTSNVFEELWAKYPNRVGKKEAFRHFQASVKTPEDLKNIGLALENYLVSDIAKKNGGEYIQNGKTWFNNWQDWITPPKTEPHWTTKLMKENK